MFRRFYVPFFTQDIQNKRGKEQIYVRAGNLTAMIFIRIIKAKVVLLFYILCNKVCVL